MKEELIANLQVILSDKINIDAIPTVLNAVSLCLQDYDIIKKQRALVRYDEGDINILKRFFIAKAVEGLSKKTLTAYENGLKHFFSICHTPIKEISPDDIRIFLAIKKSKKCGDVTMDNYRRILSSFLGWCNLEGYTKTNAALRVKKIRVPRRVKKPFSEDEMEKLRAGAKDLRTRAIVEFLYSTGCRVAEMCGANLSDIDWDEGKLEVFGKGKKYRTVYMSARCKYILQQYIESRNDISDAIFVGQQKPFPRLAPGRVEKIVRDLGTACGVEHTHPHRFRRTAATLALRRGMPIEQVQKMLGHESIATTTIYAQSTNEDVKTSHEKYII